MGRIRHRQGPWLSVPLAIVSLVLGAPAALASTSGDGPGWDPGPAKYGMAEDRHVPVEMSDGTKIYADVYYPTDESTGDAARGKFPVALMITPYGKAAAKLTGQLSGDDEGGIGAFKSMPLLVKRGYINVVAEIRGTGRSEGTFSMLDPNQGKDGAQLVRWAAQLPNSSGGVGMYGPSYMGIIQFLTAARLGPHSALKAMLPVVAPNDAYRELLTSGGILAAEADVPLLAVFAALPLVEPFLDFNPPPPNESVQALSGRPASILESLIPLAVAILTGGEQAYDEDWWQQRSVAATLPKVVHNHIPALLVGGWLDVFQRGTLMNYAGLQNIWAGRRQSAPMSPNQRLTSRYQAVMGPWSHVVAGEDFPLEHLALRWFDTWLKGERTGLKRARNPVHLYDRGRGAWFDTQRYPITSAPARTLYLNDGSTLTHAPPAAPVGSDTVPFTGVSSPCSMTTEQYSLGAAGILLGSTGNPCVQDDSTIQRGLGSLTYTTAPFSADRTIAGPIDATIFATSTRPEVELVATIEDISPNGRSEPLSSGALLGSFRAVDDRLSWTGANGRPLIAYHPYSSASVEPVPTGQGATRFDIEIPPVLATIAAAHSLRLTLTTSDTPHLLPTPSQLVNLFGGVYGVQRNASSASFVNLPLTSPARISAPCRICK